MTEVNPAFVLTTLTHNSEVLRNMVRSLRLGAGVCTSTDMAVSAPGGMFVAVAFGRAIIDGTETTLQGAYALYNDASVSKAIAAADPTNPRRDLICAKVQDQDYSGAVRAWSLAVVTGVPAVSPALPALPANAIPLADVTVPALAGSIIAGNITDIRPILGLATDATKIQALGLAAAVGTRLDVARIDHVHPFTGIMRKLDDQSTASGASVTLTVPAGTYRILELHMTGRSDQATNRPLVAQFNGDTGANYDSQEYTDINVTQTLSPPLVAQVNGHIGYLAASGAVAGAVAGYKAIIENADSTTLRKVWRFDGGNWNSDAAAGAVSVSGQGQWRNVAAAIASILLKADVGNLINFRAILVGASW